ncbi:MAG: hypothetical protein Q6373_017950 [Candidatus Sigynarchaeota archaeon]
MPKPTSKQLLNLLHEDANQSLPMLSDELRRRNFPVSRQSVGQFISRLEDEKKIFYTIVENPNIRGARTFFIEIKTNPEEPEIVLKLQEIHHVRSIDGIIGQNSLVFKCCTRDDQELSSILKQLDLLITHTRFQHYKIINCLRTFKDGGFTFPQERQDLMINKIEACLLDIMQDMEEPFPILSIMEKASMKGFPLSYNQASRMVRKLRNEMYCIPTIKISPDYIQQTDFPLKFYLQILPKNLSEYDIIAAETLAPKDEIVDLYRTGEEYGLFAVVRTSSISDYRQFLEAMYRTGKIQDTISTLVIDEKLPAIFKPFKENSLTTIMQ